jgi:hypothetical protein
MSGKEYKFKRLKANKEKTLKVENLIFSTGL